MVRTLVLLLLLAIPCYGEPQPVERRIAWRKVALLSSVQLGADLWDMQQTRAHYLEARLNHLPFVEYNPLTKSLLPHPGLLYARPVGTAALNAFLSYKLSTNRRAWIRQLRYTPQYVQISFSTQGWIYSRVHWQGR
jgi:hypothetical protein